MLTLEQKEKITQILGWQKNNYNMWDDGIMWHDIKDVDKLELLVKKIEELADETFAISKTSKGWMATFIKYDKSSFYGVSVEFVESESFVDTLQLAILKLDEVKKSGR